MYEQVWVGQIGGYGEVQAILSTHAAQRDHSWLPAPHLNLWRCAVGTGIVGWWEGWTLEQAHAVEDFLDKHDVPVLSHKPLVTYQGKQITNDGSLAGIPMSQVDQLFYNQCHFNRCIYPCRDQAQWDAWQKDERNYKPEAVPA